MLRQSVLCDLQWLVLVLQLRLRIYTFADARYLMSSCSWADVLLLVTL